MTEVETQQFLFDYQEYLSNHDYFAGWIMGVRHFFEKDKETILYFKENEDSRYRRFAHQNNPDEIERTVCYVLEEILEGKGIMPTNISTDMKTGKVTYS